MTPRAATLTLPTMFIRKTTTRKKSTNEAYFTFRLVASERTGDQVRQITLLNLGRHFDLPQPPSRPKEDILILRGGDIPIWG